MSNNFQRAEAEYYSDHEREKVTAGEHGSLCHCGECMEAEAADTQRKQDLDKAEFGTAEDFFDGAP